MLKYPFYNSDFAMTKSGITITNSSSISFSHAFRGGSEKQKAKTIKFTDEKNEYWMADDLKTFLDSNSKVDYKKIWNQHGDDLQTNRQQKAKNDFDAKRLKQVDKNSLIREACINLHSHHTIDDLKNLASKIEHEFGIETKAITIHRDEGKEITKKNYHAHIFMDFYPTKQNNIDILKANNEKKKKIRTVINLNKPELRILQTLVATELGMERGVMGNKARHIPHKQYAIQQDLKEKTQAKAQTKLDKFDTAFKFEKDGWKSEKQNLERKIGELEHANRELVEDNAILESNYTPQEMEEIYTEIADLKTEKESLQSTAEGLEKNENHLKEKINSLEKSNKKLKDKIEQIKKNAVTYIEILYDPYHKILDLLGRKLKTWNELKDMKEYKHTIKTTILHEVVDEYKNKITQPIKEELKIKDLENEDLNSKLEIKILENEYLNSELEDKDTEIKVLKQQKSNLDKQISKEQSKKTQPLEEINYQSAGQYEPPESEEKSNQDDENELDLGM